MSWDAERAYNERIRLVKVLSFINNDGGKCTGLREWHVYYLGYLDGKRLFYGENDDDIHSAWYSVATDCWLYQSNDAHPTDNFWQTFNEELAQEYIQKCHWKVEDVDA